MFMHRSCAEGSNEKKATTNGKHSLSEEKGRRFHDHVQYNIQIGQNTYFLNEPFFVRSSLEKGKPKEISPDTYGFALS